MKLKFSERSDGVLTGFYHWNLLGLWFEGKPKIYYLYSIILHFLITHFYTITAFSSIFVEKNLASATDSVYLSFSEVAFLVKINTVFLLQKSYQQLYKAMYSELKMINENDLYEQELIKRGQKRSKQLLYTVLIVYLLTITFLIVKPFFATEKALPFKAVFPFEWRRPYIHPIAHVYQSIGIVLQIVLSAGLDTIPSSVMIMVCQYCEVISYNFKNLGISEYSNTDAKRKEVLKRILHNYTILKQILKLVTTGFSAILFVQFFLSTVIVCTTAFQMSIAERKVEILFMALYMFAMNIQIFIPCYFGNELFLTSASLNNSLFNSNWVYFDRKLNKDIILLMEFLKKPLIMLAGGLIELKLSAFLATINFAYSIYNLLHKVQSKGTA